MKRASDLGTSPTRAFSVRFAIHVQPGARVPKVGGTKAGSLSVRVRERAVEGAANEAVIEAVARALAVKPRAIRIVHGRQSRRKLLEVTVDDDALIDQRLTSLRHSG
ncbi:MAG: DUF167 domain-containing protein [Actinomycetes bacterium]